MVKADPSRKVVALSGDYDFQFMIEELAVGAQFNLPYVHVLVNNAYLGLIRQAQRGFDMDYCVQLAFENINATEAGSYGVDHVAVVEGLGCKALRVFEPAEIAPALLKAQKMAEEFRVPVVVEVILERVTNISMGTEINAVNEFEDLARSATTRLPRSRCWTDRLTPRAGCAGAFFCKETTMPRFAANLSMLFTEQDFLARFKAAADAGFSGVEYLFPYDFSATEIKQQLDAHGLTQVLFNLPAGDWGKGERGIACNPERVEEFRAGVDKAIEYAKVLGNTQVNCLAGIRPQGPDCATVRKTFVDNLKYAADKLKAAGIRLVMEMINTRDIPGFYLNTTKQALEIQAEVGSDNLFLQYDIYHMQIMEGDLARTMEANLKLINHIQLADNPGRNEPGTGEINYRFLFEHGPHRLPGLGGRGIQAADHHRSRPGLAENPQRNLKAEYSPCGVADTVDAGSPAYTGKPVPSTEVSASRVNPLPQRPRLT